MTNCQPYPCYKCCRECAALFAENWAARLCLVAGTYVGSIWDAGAIPAGADASLAAWVAAQNTFFNNVSVTWTTTTYTLFGNAYSGKVCEAINSTSYNLELVDTASASPYTWYTVPVDNCKLTLGSIWKTTHSGSGDFPKRCAPAWFWQLSANINGKQCNLCAGANPTGSSVLSFSEEVLNGDGYAEPFSFVNTGDNPRCQIANIYGATSTISQATSIKDGSSRNYYWASGFNPRLITSSSRLRLVHTTGTPSLPSC